MRRTSPILRLIATAILLAGSALVAQVQVGDNTSLNLSGNVGFGYSGSYGDTVSSHGIGLQGNADLSGYYYSPKFVTFHVDPFLNQSRSSSNFDSTTTTDGFRANASIFSGSHFPGWVNYSRTYNNSSNFGIPGLAGFVNHGNSDSFGVGWAETLPERPHVSVAYQQGDTTFQTYGMPGESQSNSRIFSTSANHRIAGFGLTGNYHRGTHDSEVPPLGTGQLTQNSDSHDSSYSFGISHALPFRGAAQANYSSSSYEFTTDSSKNSGGIDTMSASASVVPTDKLSVDTTLLYTDNLVGTLYQTIMAAGGIIQNSLPGGTSTSMGLSGTASYAVTRQMRVTGRLDHRQQMWAGSTYGSDSMGGIFTYFRGLIGGKLSVSESVNRNTESANNQSDLGVSSSASYSRAIRAWNIAGSFVFNRNQATALVIYQNNSYSYTGSVGRPLGKFYVSGSASASKSTVGGVQGSATTSRSYTASLSMRKVGVSASYSTSSGNAIQTAAGLTPSPLPLPVLPTTFVLYGGHSYSFGAGGSPIRGLTFNATFVNTLSNTGEVGGNSRNSSQTANFYMDYKFRKMNFHAGYTRTFQGFSLSNTREQLVTSYYFGISRWFNFF